MFVTKMFDDRSKTNYQVHQDVRIIFPENQRVLFQRLNGILTVVSQYKPNTPIKTEEVTSLTEDQYLFSLLIVPAVRKNGVTKPVQNQKQWTLDKLAKTGIDIVPETVSITPKQHICYKKGNSFSLSTVLVTGVLNVMDKDKMLQTCQSGVGRVRFDGFGLLNIF